MDEKWKQYDKEAFFLKNINIEKLFDIIDRTDYFFLYNIKNGLQGKEPGQGVYLRDLADAMKFSIPEVSKAVKNLEDKGYVLWKTDSKKEKTYVLLTSKATELMEEQKRKMTESYDKIVGSISGEDVEVTLETLKKIRDLIVTD